MLSRRLLASAVVPAVLALALAQPLAGSAARGATPPGPVAGANSLVDQDHALPFSSSKQNETAVTRDPVTGVLVAGANDEIGEGPCPGTATPLASPCPFVRGVGVSGYYRSTDNGASWTGGVLAGTPGRSSGGDPSLDNGPRRCADGHVSYSCGTVIYYANLEDPVNLDLHFSEALGVARSYDDGASWTPVEVSSVSRSEFDDHEWIAVDNRNPSSPFYGRVYVFWAVFCASCAGNGNVKLYVAHSADEGLTFTAPVQVSGASNNVAQGFRETGQMAVASNGTVEAFWSENEDATRRATLQVVAVSSDGGQTFSAPITISPVTDYPLTGTPFDAVDLFNRVPGMSARVDCFPHPAADPASDRVYVVWCDFAGGNGHGNVRAAVSADGVHWTSLGVIGAVAGRNAFFPAAAVSPSGTLSVAFDALTAPPDTNPWQTGIQVYDVYYLESLDGGATFTAPIRVSTASSNPQASAYNNLQEQFIGDYLGIVDGPAGAVIVWTDARNAALCPAVAGYQSAVYAGSRTAVAPNPNAACPASFGNTDTYAAAVAY